MKHALLKTQYTRGFIIFAAITAMATSSQALIIPGGGSAVPAPIAAPDAGFNCNSLKSMTQYDTYKVKLEDIRYCAGQGYSPPRTWQRSASGVNDAEGGAVALSSKCPPRPARCKGFASAGGQTAVPAFNINLPPRTNPKLTIPPFKTPVNGSVRMPCGGSMSLDIGSLINQGGTFVNNVRFGNVGGAISTGLSIASGLTSSCGGGGILNMIQGAINMVMPSGCSVNITSGTAATCSGTVLSLPAGVTMNMSANGLLTFPNGGSFTDSAGANISFGGNSKVQITGTAPNLKVNVTDQLGTVTVYNAASGSEVKITPTDTGSGGMVLVPEGASLPVDTNSTVLPASAP